MQPFVVMGLARSRSLWLARHLSYGPWHCGHDELQYMRTLDDVRTWFKQPFIGSVETAAAPFWRTLLRYQPDVRIATVRRPVQEVVASLVRAGLPDTPELRAMMQAHDRKLDQIERRIPGVLSVTFDELGTERGCARIFEHCLQMPHDRSWWLQWRKRRMSGNILAQVRYYQAYGPKLEKLARAAKQETLFHMAAHLRTPDGITFQEEPLDVCMRDAIPLVRAHMVATGQDVDEFANKDVSTLCHLDALGMLQIVTARSNGRIFGYRMTVISPSLDQEGELQAEHLPICADPACRGLGMKLNRAADDALAAKGVTSVTARAGIVGSGPRMGALYRRLGYEEFGTLYRRDLTTEAA